MNKVIKYKLNYLLSNKLILIFSAILFLLLNFNALSSGVLTSVGSAINIEAKYQLLFNNYLVVSVVYGLIMAIFLGSSIVGPDAQTGNIQVILTSYHSRTKYFIGTFLAVLIYSTVIQILLFINIYLLMLIFKVPYLWSDILVGFTQNYLNMLVAMSVTGLASIFIKGHGSAFVGLLAYTYYNVYEYNALPFINSSLPFNIAQYRNILGNFFPISYFMAPSYTEPSTIAYFKFTPIIPNIYIYQILYIALILVLSCVFFNRKEI